MQELRVLRNIHVPTFDVVVHLRGSDEEASVYIQMHSVCTVQTSVVVNNVAPRLGQSWKLISDRWRKAWTMTNRSILCTKLTPGLRPLSTVNESLRAVWKVFLLDQLRAVDDTYLYQYI